jgi:hypothetical protein
MLWILVLNFGESLNCDQILDSVGAIIYKTIENRPGLVLLVY